MEYPKNSNEDINIYQNYIKEIQENINHINIITKIINYNEIYKNESVDILIVYLIEVYIIKNTIYFKNFIKILNDIKNINDSMKKHVINQIIKYEKNLEEFIPNMLTMPQEHKDNIIKITNNI